MSDIQTPAKKARPSLFGAVGMAAAASPVPEPVTADREGAKPATRRASVRGRQDRNDKRQIAGFFSPECAKQLRMLAAEEDTTVQDLLREGLNLMFASHGKSPIA